MGSDGLGNDLMSYVQSGMSWFFSVWLVAQHAKQLHFLGPTPNADRMMHLSVPSVLLQEAMEQKISVRNETEKRLNF